LKKPVIIDRGMPEDLIIANSSSKQSSFGVDVFKLSAGTVISQTLAVIIAPILTHFYDPSAFGILAVFTSITAIITIISCLRYEFSIMLPESNEEAGNLLMGSILISIIVSFCTVLVVWLGNATITRLLNAPELGPYLWLIPPTVLLGGVSVGHPALNYWTTRNKHFGWLSFARIFGVVFTIGFQIIAILLGYATGGSLILASVVGGGLVSTLILGCQIGIFDGKFLIKSFSWRMMYQGLKRHYKFPLFDSWAALLDAISSQLPTFFITALFSSSVTGFYALGNRVLNLPMTIIGSAIGQVFYQRAAEAKANGTLAQVVESTFYYLVMLGMFPLLILTIVGKDLFVAVFGSRWSEAGVFAQILSLYLFVSFISSPLITIFRLLEKQEFLLFLNIVLFITRIISLGIGGLLGSPRIVLLIFAGTGIIVYGSLCFIIMTVAGVPLSRMFKIIITNLLLFSPAGILLFISQELGLRPWFIILLSTIILILYFLFMIKKDPRIPRMINQILYMSGLVKMKENRN